MGIQSAQFYFPVVSQTVYFGCMRYAMEPAIVAVLVEMLPLPRRQIFPAIWNAQILWQVFLRHKSNPLRWISDDELKLVPDNSFASGFR
jgi:hypothetical protein